MVAGTTPSNPFQKIYIDAFAGTGYRDARRDDKRPSTQSLLFPDLAELEAQTLLDGSARLALQTEPSFDKYIFIDRSAERCTDLEDLKAKFEHLAPRIQINRGNANTEIQKLCSEDWHYRRAVLFLDPHGMQVEWKTMEAIAKTKAIDPWVALPAGHWS
jgi:three-Cys-motif partner protein